MSALSKPLALPFDPMCSCEHSLFEHHGTKGGRCLVCPCEVFTNVQTSMSGLKSCAG